MSSFKLLKLLIQDKASVIPAKAGIQYGFNALRIESQPHGSRPFRDPPCNSVVIEKSLCPLPALWNAKPIPPGRLERSG